MGLAEILVASADGMGLLWSPENTGHFEGAGNPCLAGCICSTVVTG